MSNRAHRTRRGKPRPMSRHEMFGTTIGWCLPDALEECKRTTHDRLLLLMGATRTGAVRWYVAGEKGPEDARNLLTQYMLGHEDDPAHVAAAAEIDGLITASGGYVVVAAAPGQPVHL